MKVLTRAAVIALATLCLGFGIASAVQPDEMLDDPVLEERARELSKILRCLVCQNQSIDDSDAELARDLRIIVRQRLVAGDSDEETIQYIVARYGDYVLLKPPLTPTTVVLWFGSIAILVIAGGALFMAARRRQREAGPSELTDAEKARMAELLKANGDS